MSRRWVLLSLACLLVACGDTPALPDVDLSLTITVGAEEVELGSAFPLTVVRAWSKDLVPAEWDDRSLAPLHVRLEEITRREDDRHIEETRRYRGYAFTLSDVVIPAPVLTARPKNGGRQRATEADGIRLRIRPALDPTSPGPPELPGEPLPEPFPWTPWVLGVTAALAALMVGLVRLRRRPPTPDVPVLAEPPPIPPHVRALERLRRLGERTPRGLDEIRSDVVEASDVVRGYVAEQLPLRAWEKTTQEILIAPETRRSLGPAHQAVLQDLLTQCDLVKFAAHAPSAAERSRLLHTAEVFVRKTGTGSAAP